MAVRRSSVATRQSGPQNSGSSAGRNRPPEDKEVAAAERAPKRQKNPVERCFEAITVSHSSEIDRPAMWAPCDEHMFGYGDPAGLRGISRTELL